MMECKKIGLVGSSGGHLTHLYMLKPFWQKKDRFWVTFDKEDARSLLEGERVYPCYYPTNRNLNNLLKYSGCMEGTQKGEAGSADLFRSGGCSSFLLSGKADGKEADLCGSL